MRAVWMVLAVAQAAVAQETVERLTLAQATERALAVSPTLGRLRAGERAADADVRAASASRRPQLELQAGYTRQSDVPDLAVDGQVLLPNLPDNFRTRAAAAVPLYTGGRLARAVDSAR